MICVPYHDSKILFYYDGDLKLFVFHLMYFIFLNYKIYRDTFDVHNILHKLIIKSSEIPTLDNSMILIRAPKLATLCIV